MNPDFLILGVLRSVMGGGRKKSKRAMRYLTGSHGSIWSNPTTLLTAAGLAWGVYETMSSKGDGTQWAGGGGAAGTAPGASPAPNAPWGGGTTPPPAGVGMSAVPLPPLPNAATAATPDVGDDALRLIRLAVSAANADGVMNDQERAAVLQQAQAAGVRDVLDREMAQARPLAEIVAGVTDPSQGATLYVLAFTVLRADEQLNGAERIYLAQLAHLLGLDRATVERLEKDTGERIDALGDQGQLGG